MSSARTRATWPAIAFVVILVELLGWNLHVFVRNQKEFEVGDKPQRSPRALASVAEKNVFGIVKYAFAFYYRMRDLEGATVVVPARLEGHRYHLERVSRVKVEIAPGELEISPETLVKLDAKVTRYLHLDAETQVVVMRDPSVRRYVMANVTGQLTWVLMPESLYGSVGRGAQAP